MQTEQEELYKENNLVTLKVFKLLRNLYQCDRMHKLEKSAVNFIPDSVTESLGELESPHTFYFDVFFCKLRSLLPLGK